MFNWLHALPPFLQSQILDPLLFMLHTFLSALINMKLPHTKIPPATALCSRHPPHFNVSGAFLTCCVAARRWANTHVQPYSTTTNLQGVVLVQLREAAASLCKILFHSARVISPSHICHISSCHPDGFIRAQHTRLEIPSTPLFLSRIQNLFGCERDCRFFHVTQSINLLFYHPALQHTWEVGAEDGRERVHGDHDKACLRFMLFIIFPSFRFSSSSLQ